MNVELRVTLKDNIIGWGQRPMKHMSLESPLPESLGVKTYLSIYIYIYITNGDFGIFRGC